MGVSIHCPIFSFQSIKRGNRGNPEITSGGNRPEEPRFSPELGASVLFYLGASQ